MYIVWWILTIISMLVGIVGIVGIFNPDLLNKDLKKGTEPWTRKQASWTFIACLILVALFSSLAINHSKTSTKQVTKTAETTVKSEPVKKKEAQKKNTKSNNKTTLENQVTDQYFEDFLTFMDQFHTDLLQEVKDNQSESVIAVFLGKENAEGWKQYDKINSQPTPSTDSQFEQRVDVLHAWQSLYQLDMDYDSYVMNDTNITSTTLNSDEQAYLSDFNKANGDFAKK